MCYFKVKVLQNAIAVFIVMGTASGNTFLSRFFQINDKKSMMNYTAQNAKDFIKCNRPYIKGIDIAKSNKVMKYGVFKNPGRVWDCEYKKD